MFVRKGLHAPTSFPLSSVVAKKSITHLPFTFHMSYIYCRFLCFYVDCKFLLAVFCFNSIFLKTNKPPQI